MAEQNIWASIKELANQGKTDEALTILDDYTKNWAEIPLQEKEEILLFQIDVCIKDFDLSKLHTDHEYYQNIKDLIDTPISLFKDNILSVGESKDEKTKQLQKYLEAVELMAQQKYYSELDEKINAIGARGCDRESHNAENFEHYYSGYLKLRMDILSAFFVLGVLTQSSYLETNHYKEAGCVTSNKLFARALAITEKISEETTQFPYFYDYDVNYMYLIAIYLVDRALRISGTNKVTHLKHQVALMCDHINAILVKEGQRVSLMRDETLREQTYKNILAREAEIQQYEPDYSHPSVNKELVLIGSNQSSGGGCYIATAVYGSYDCPEVWTLRRYRDDTLASTWYGRAFIRTYYAVSPSLCKWFGHTMWFKKMWKGTLDRKVATLQKNGVDSAPYEDRKWN